jgi:L-alanine-DL-glutamate epimerase-like enolase superfamily enzyme
MPDAIKICNEMRSSVPIFVEDIVRSENPGVYKTVRQMTKVPLAVGEQFGDRWDTNELIEERLIDYTAFTTSQYRGHFRIQKKSPRCVKHIM